MLRSMTSLKRAVAPLDIALTALLVAVAVAYMIAVIGDEGGSWAAVPVFALVPLGLLWRRTAPLHAIGGLIVAVGLHAALFGTMTRCGIVLPVAFLLAFSAGARLPRPLAMAGWALALGGALLMLGFDQSAPLDDAGVFVAVLTTVVWAAGAVLRTVARREPATGLALDPARG
jgi:hypothetical protein